jgi:YgiT-type zinc finger domain-containing protein
MKKTKEQCAVCGKSGVIHRRLPRTYGKGATLLVVENVPVVPVPTAARAT